MQKKIRHDAYGKAVLKRAAGAQFDGSQEACRVDYGGAQNTGGFIDGTAMGTVAIEVESRTSKQVRGAVLDLICHRFEKKLLVLLDVRAYNVKILADQCANAFNPHSPDERVKLLHVRGDLAILSK